MTAWWLQSAWVWYGAGLGLGLLGAALLLWAVFWDRSKGRRRCPRCWYDMSGAGTAGAPDGEWVCPECGRRGAGARPLHRTRRRWGWAMMALLVVSGAWVVAEQPQIRKRGWMWLAPTWTLVQALPLQGADGVIAEELRRRLGRSAWPDRDWVPTMSDSQVASLFETCADGTWLARPIGERWKRSFGEFARQEMVQVYNTRVQPFPGTTFPGEGHLTGDRLARAVAACERLAKLHEPLSIRTRSRWPRGVPVHVEVPLENWWDRPQDHWMHIRWEVEGGEKGEGWCLEHRELNIPGTGHVRVKVELEWVAGKKAPWSADDRRVEDRASRVLEYDVVDSVSDVMTPVTSSAIDGVLGSLVVDYRGLFDGPSVWKARATLPADVSFGLRVEFLLNEEVIGTSRARFVGGAGPSGSLSGPDFPTLRSYEETQKMIANPNLKARIVADPIWALQNIDVTKYWQGQLDITIAPPPRSTRPPMNPQAKPVNPATSGSSKDP